MIETSRWQIGQQYPRCPFGCDHTRCGGGRQCCQERKCCREHRKTKWTTVTWVRLPACREMCGVQRRSGFREGGNGIISQHCVAAQRQVYFRPTLARTYSVVPASTNLDLARVRCVQLSASLKQLAWNRDHVGSLVLPAGWLLHSPVMVRVRTDWCWFGCSTRSKDRISG